jgi:hypothetical protein
MYTTVAACIAYAGIPEPTYADSELLTAFIAGAQAYIDRTCHQSFEAAADSTRFFDALCDVTGRTLWLDAPLCAVTSITNGDGSLIAPSAYITEPRHETPWYAISLRSNSGISWTYNDAAEDAIVITGRWAYSLTPDAGIVQISKEIVAYYWRQKDSTGDADRAVLAGNSTLIPATIPQDITDKLQSYRRALMVG